MRDILLDDLVRHVTAGAHEVPSCPEVAAPELLLQTPILRQKMVTGLALDRLHQATRRYMRWSADEKVHVVLPDRSPKDLDIMSPTDLADQIAHPDRHLSPQDRLAVLRREDEVVVQFMNGVRTSLILPHGGLRTASPLKAPPEGGGFHPPGMGQ